MIPDYQTLMLPFLKAVADGQDHSVRDVSKRIVLIDGQEGVEHMMDFGVGVDTTRTYELKEIDLSYFDAE